MSVSPHVARAAAASVRGGCGHTGCTARRRSHAATHTPSQHEPPPPCGLLLFAWQRRSAPRSACIGCLHTVTFACHEDSERRGGCACHRGPAWSPQQRCSSRRPLQPQLPLAAPVTAEHRTTKRPVTVACGACIRPFLRLQGHLRWPVAKTLCPRAPERAAAAWKLRVLRFDLCTTAARQQLRC